MVTRAFLVRLMYAIWSFRVHAFHRTRFRRREQRLNQLMHHKTDLRKSSIKKWRTAMQRRGDCRNCIQTRSDMPETPTPWQEYTCDVLRLCEAPLGDSTVNVFSTTWKGSGMKGVSSFPVCSLLSNTVSPVKMFTSPKARSMESVHSEWPDCVHESYKKCPCDHNSRRRLPNILDWSITYYGLPLQQV